jgi:hypothetical protein
VIQGRSQTEPTEYLCFSSGLNKTKLHQQSEADEEQNICSLEEESMKKYYLKAVSLPLSIQFFPIPSLVCSQANSESTQSAHKYEQIPKASPPVLAKQEQVRIPFPLPVLPV